MTKLALPTAHTKDRVKTPVPDRVDVAIIGAGLGGLMSAARLARKGLSVALFDGHYVAGGCCTMFHRATREGSYQFDIGLHYIGDCEPTGKIPTLLRDVGVDLEYVRMDDDGFDTIVVPGLTFPIPADLGRFRDRLVEHFPREKRGIDRYTRVLGEVSHMGAWLEQTRAGGTTGKLATLWQVATRARLVSTYQNATVKELLDDCTKDETLRAVLLGQSGDYGVAPSKASAMMHLGLQAHYLKGAYYPKGGGQRIADELADVVEANGGVICLRRTVESILVEGGRAVGVRIAEGREPARDVRAGCVISNADLKRTYTELLPEAAVPAEWRVRREKLEMGAAIFITCLGIKADLRTLGMAAKNVWRFNTTDAESIYDEIDRGETTASCAYITSASLKDPDSHGHTPPGVMGVEVMTIASGRPEAWGVEPGEVLSGVYRKQDVYEAKKREVEDRLIDHLEAQFPGTKEHIVFRESATPITHSRYTRASDGTGYGLAATPGQFMASRPGYRGPVPGLYFAGANTRAGHGVSGALNSGKHAAARLLADREGSS
ncbi:MAG: NAD(P)/FAD-dependent oxidoreductase [Pseudomonadota bacterium]|nr:NAD(P)/FAD-dependent oxidoreductase [Pseudomonadota bacterium]